MHDFSLILKEELVCALGCTEPIAVALAGARAKELLRGEPVKVDIYCSGNIIKNVKGVTVPNSGGMKGIEAAAALGIAAGRSDQGLEVLSQVGEADIEKAKQMIEDKVLDVHLKEGVENLDIEIQMTDRSGNHVIVEIMNKHNNIVRISRNGQEFVEAQVMGKEAAKDLYKNLNIHNIIEYANTVELSEVSAEIDNQITLNRNISSEGLTGKWGSAIGKILLASDEKVRTRARAMAAAGSDARMSGCSMPVVINAGSGNQGITCCIPVMEYAKELGSTEEQLKRALLVSNLTALHIKRYIGRLSAFCGVTSAGAAAAAGIAYLHDSQDESLIERTIENTLMIVSGMVCDGAKPSCAAKIASAVDAGITGFEMAYQNRDFRSGEGLMKGNVEETIRSIGRMGAEGMKQTDIEILNIMLDR